MISFTHKTTRYTVNEANAQAYRAALDKPKKHKPVGLSPVKYSYPAFVPGMSTAEYVRQFTQLNTNRIELAHECPNYYKPAPMLDASQPEVVEELDPDYVEPIKAAKPKKTKQTNEAHAQALRAIALLTHDGSHDSVRIAFEHAQRIALGALEGVQP